VSDRAIEALVLGAFGTLVLLIVVASLREAAAMKRWPIAKGRVLSSKVEEYRELAGAGDYSGSRTRMTLYRPVVLYEYEVDGKRLEGNRITQSSGLNRGIPDFAEKIVQRYSRGTAVEVRYNPKRPRDCVLEPRVPAGWIFALAIALILLGLAVYVYSR
jgi:hypothetical protein